MILSDYRCADHGVFEARAASDADAVPCPTCGASSPWSPSPVFGRVQLVTATTGKWDKAPTPQHLDVVSSLGTGQKYGEWRQGRKKMWREHDYRKRKERG